MSARVFVDTNILVYAHTRSTDPRHELARERIRDLWSKPDTAWVSVQVLQELHVNLIKKCGLPAPKSAQLVQTYFAWNVVESDVRLLQQSFDLQQRFPLSFWDALILAAAKRAGASELWSEDFQTGRTLDDVRVMNPLGV